MNIELETTINFDDKGIEKAFVTMVNIIICTEDENSLRNELELNKGKFDDYFKYGFGVYHLWVHQRVLKNAGQVFKNRLLIVIL